jgi:hypothetical protein
LVPPVAHFASPVTNPERVKLRRNDVLDRMAKKGKISIAQGRVAKNMPLELRISNRHQALAPYFAEEIRKGLEQKYGSEAVNESGLRIYTTLNIEMQQTANEAIRSGLENFDRRHGWRGVRGNILKLGDTTLDSYRHEDWKRSNVQGAILTGLVLAVKPRVTQIKFGEYEATLSDSDVAWTGKKSLMDLFKVGDLALFRVSEVDSTKKKLKVALYQRPEVQGALVALDSATGAVKAMVGGYDFDQSKFNRATQAYRQAVRLAPDEIGYRLNLAQSLESGLIDVTVVPPFLSRRLADKGFTVLGRCEQTKLPSVGMTVLVEKPYLQQINRLGINDDVILRTDFIPDSEVKYYLCAADAVIQPYRNATQSGVTPLAYYFEKPMIVTNVGGLPSLVPNEKAGLVTEPTAQSIANAILRFYQLGENYFLPHLRSEKQKYSWSNLTNVIKEISKN